MKAQWPLQAGSAHQTISNKLLQHLLEKWTSDLEGEIFIVHALVSKLGSACKHTPPVDDRSMQQLFLDSCIITDPNKRDCECSKEGPRI